MIRTQIQLSETQLRQLKDIARRQGKSVAALIREGADAIILSDGAPDSEQKIRRALAAAGRFHSGRTDLASAHDRHFAETLAE